MPRRGIELTEEQWRLAKANAARSGVTLSAYFAELLRIDIAKRMNGAITEAEAEPVVSHKGKKR